MPTGGEFVTVPVQKDAGRYDVSKKIVTCLTSSSSLLATDTTLTYIAPTASVQAQQVARNAELKPWVAAVAAARGRTSGGLGGQVSGDIAAVVDGRAVGVVRGKSPGAALDVAQSAAGKG